MRKNTVSPHLESEQESGKVSFIGHNHLPQTDGDEAQKGDRATDSLNPEPGELGEPGHEQFVLKPRCVQCPRVFVMLQLLRYSPHHQHLCHMKKTHHDEDAAGGGRRRRRTGPPVKSSLSFFAPSFCFSYFSENLQKSLCFSSFSALLLLLLPHRLRGRCSSDTCRPACELQGHFKKMGLFISYLRKLTTCRLITLELFNVSGILLFLC